MVPAVGASTYAGGNYLVYARDSFESLPRDPGLFGPGGRIFECAWPCR